MANRLANSPSLYLRKHAPNPIDWWPWCDQALAKAKAENKPIFLSIGYSSCHWCTVMESEAFSDNAIATTLNDNFIAIKVDREERPDIDSIYMKALQMMVGQGGWPLNIFLDPHNLTPFYGGTYFPVEPNYGRPAFGQVLNSLRTFYDNEKEKLSEVTAEIRSGLERQTQIHSDPALPNVQPTGLSDELRNKGLDTAVRVIKPNVQGNSFPMMPYAQAALAAAQLSDNQQQSEATKALRQRGLDLSLGGIFDQVAGGFHRYTVDPTWTLPHFEKMLYDNGQIVEFLAQLWRCGQKEPAFERAVEQTFLWLKREMLSPDGYFYAAQDADSFETPDSAEPEEGAFYVWQYAELKALLSKEQLEAMSQAFDIAPNGNFESKIVLQRRSGGVLNETVEQALVLLFAARYGNQPANVSTFAPARNNDEAKQTAWPKRIPAVTDTKMIVAWNSLMISGLAEAAVAFGKPEYWILAAQTAQFIWQHQRVKLENGNSAGTRRLHRLNYDGQADVLAQSEDYALFIKALIDLQQAQLSFPTLSVEQPLGSDIDWLEAAETIQAEFDRYLGNSDRGGGYYNTDARTDLLVRERSYDDNATPSANGIAASNLVRLALLTDDLSYLAKAEATINAFQPAMEQLPQGCPGLFTALEQLKASALVKTDSDRIPSLAAGPYISACFAITQDLPTGCIGLLCQGMTCAEPAQSLEQLEQQLRDRRGLNL